MIHKGLHVIEQELNWPLVNDTKKTPKVLHVVEQELN